MEIRAQWRILVSIRDDGAKVVHHDRPYPEGERQSAQVLRFRLRPRAADRASRDTASEPSDRGQEALDDLAQYEEEHEDLNYRHRMLMNVIAVAVVSVLVGVGVWLADIIAVMQRDQDCVLQGRQNCAPIEVPPHKK
jgi:hypothetical protein